MDNMEACSYVTIGAYLRKLLVSYLLIAYPRSFFISMLAKAGSSN